MAHFHWNGDAIAREIRRRAGMGIKAAVIHLTNRVKEVLSEPAPRVRFTDKAGATFYRAGWLVNKTPSGVTGKLQMLRSYKMVGGKLVPKTVMFIPSKATPGAPPRKLSGRLRASWTWEVNEDALVGRSGTNVVYARAHEKGTHPFAMATLQKYRQEIETILGTMDFNSDRVFPSK